MSNKLIWWCRNIKFKILSDIINLCDLEMVENKLDDFNSLELYFYKNNKLGKFNKDLELAGKMYYDSDTNHLDIIWEGKTPEVIVMAVDSYIRELYQKKPNKFSKDSKGKIEPFKINEA